MVALTLSTALLQWAGYHRLSAFVWIRTWAVAGLFVVAVFLHQALRSLLQRLILPADAVGSEEASTFLRSARRLLGYVGSIIVFVLALDLTGLRAPLVNGLSIELTTLGSHPLTPMVLIEGAAIIAAFIFMAQLLRDYLEYQVYPALNVDPGVAHAIDTFIVYALAIVGGLAALEVVGLGAGTITLFAGAFGIGLGLGLQSLANNIASGMTIIFGRALRRGDIVTVGETIGVVQEVGIRATRMRTRDDVDYLIPNAEFISGKIIKLDPPVPVSENRAALQTCHRRPTISGSCCVKVCPAPIFASSAIISSARPASPSGISGIHLILIHSSISAHVTVNGAARSSTRRPACANARW